MNAGIEEVQSRELALTYYGLDRRAFRVPGSPDGLSGMVVGHASQPYAQGPENNAVKLELIVKCVADHFPEGATHWVNHSGNGWVHVVYVALPN